MTLKEMLIQNFSDKKIITQERLKSSKFAFVICAFLFFLNFYFVGAQFYTDIFEPILGISYILMLISFTLYAYFFLKNKFIDKEKSFLFIILNIFLILLLVILLMPIIFKGGIVGLIDKII